MTASTVPPAGSFLATGRGRVTLALLCAVTFLDVMDGAIVNDSAGQPAATVGELAGALNGWVRRLARRDRPLRDLDEGLAAALGGLQADRGLRPHVGAGAGKPGRD